MKTKRSCLGGVGGWWRLLVGAALPLWAGAVARAGLAEGRAAWAAGNAELAAAEFAAVPSGDPAYVEARVNLAFAKLALIAADPAVVAEAARWGLAVEVDGENLGAASAAVRWETLAASAWSFSASGGEGGGDAARSGRSRHLWASALAAEFTGPGTLSFYWRLDDPAPEREVGLYFTGGASASVAVGEKTDFVRGLAANESETVTDLFLGAGTHRVHWLFFDPTDSDATGAALYLDQVVFTPEAGGVAPPAAPGGTSVGAGADSGAAFVNAGETDRPVFDQPTAAEWQAFLRETLAPRLMEVEALLGAYSPTGPAFVTLDWSGAEWLPGGLAGGVYRFDSGDAMALRAALLGLTGFLQVAPDRWELGAVPIVASMMGPRADGTNPGNLLADHATLLTPRAGATPGAAATALDGALALLRGASEVIGARDPGTAAQHFVPAVEALSPTASPFLFPAEFLPGGLGWADIDAKVPEGSSVTAITENFAPDPGGLAAAPLFGSGLDLRALLPVIEGEHAVLGGRSGGLATFADPSFGGVLSGVSDADLTEGLAEDGAGAWSFDRWRTYRGGSGTLAEYVFAGHSVDLSRVNVYLSQFEAGLYGDGEWGRGVGDHMLTAETSPDLANWTPATGGETGWLGADNGYWWFNYTRNTAPPSRLFFRLKSHPIPWPADPTGWTIEFERRGPGDLHRWVFTGPATVQWVDVSGSTVLGTYAARSQASGTRWVVRVEAALPAQLEFEAGAGPASAHGTLFAVPYSDPLMVADDTALHLFELIGYGAAVDSETKSADYVIDAGAKTVTPAPVAP